MGDRFDKFSCVYRITALNWGYDHRFHRLARHARCAGLSRENDPRPMTPQVREGAWGRRAPSPAPLYPTIPGLGFSVQICLSLDAR